MLAVVALGDGERRCSAAASLRRRRRAPRRPRRRAGRSRRRHRPPAAPSALPREAPGVTAAVHAATSLRALPRRAGVGSERRATPRAAARDCRRPSSRFPPPSRSRPTGCASSRRGARCAAITARRCRCRRSPRCWRAWRPAPARCCRRRCASTSSSMRSKAWSPAPTATSPARHALLRRRAPGLRRAGPRRAPPPSTRTSSATPPRCSCWRSIAPRFAADPLGAGARLPPRVPRSRAGRRARLPRGRGPRARRLRRRRVLRRRGGGAGGRGSGARVGRALRRARREGARDSAPEGQRGSPPAATHGCAASSSFSSRLGAWAR